MKDSFGKNIELSPGSILLFDAKTKYLYCGKDLLNVYFWPINDREAVMLDTYQAPEKIVEAVAELCSLISGFPIEKDDKASMLCYTFKTGKKKQDIRNTDIIFDFQGFSVRQDNIILPEKILFQHDNPSAYKMVANLCADVLGVNIDYNRSQALPAFALF